MTPNRTAIRTMASITLAVTLAFTTHASANILVNGSFEQAANLNTNSTLAAGATNLTGWTVVGGGNLIWCNSGPYCARPANDGAYSLDLTGLTNVAPYAGVRQTVATQVGTAYELQFAIAGRSDSAPIALLAQAGDTAATFSNAGAAWQTKTLSFVASTASTSITLSGVSAGGTGLMLALDNVSLVAAPVPEPGTWALMLGGVAALGALARRRVSSGPATPTGPSSAPVL